MNDAQRGVCVLLRSMCREIQDDIQGPFEEELTTAQHSKIRQAKLLLREVWEELEEDDA